MKSRIGMIGISLLFALAFSAKAEQKSSLANPSFQISYPGNVWGLVGAISPMERDNILLQFHAEQGFIAWKCGDYYLMPYAAADFVRDSKEYDWNNKVVLKLGSRLARVFPKGIVQVGVANGYEQRIITGNLGNEFITSLDYWFGWGQSVSVSGNKLLAFPGSTWGSVGNLSPFERGNMIAMADVTQGVRIFQRGSLNLIPFVKLQLGADSKGYDWNNKAIEGAGVKVAFTRKVGVIELGLQYLNENRFKSSANANMLSFFGNFWFGWCPKEKGVR